jgi:hypothetical protein
MSAVSRSRLCVSVCEATRFCHRDNDVTVTEKCRLTHEGTEFQEVNL